MKPSRILSIFLGSLFYGSASEYVVSPDPLLGNSFGSGPFLFTRAEASNERYQEVHSASDFTAAQGPSLLITEISYSAPTWSGRVPIDVVLPNIEIRMSTTAKNPDALSANFAENVGTGQAVVYSGPLRFYETEVEQYDIHIPITPFAYDPGAGNLLLEIFNYAPIAQRQSGWGVDLAFWFGDSVSLVSGGVNDTSGFFSTAGMMTRFTYTPVPEPSTWALLAIGLVSFGVAAFKRRRR